MNVTRWPRDALIAVSDHFLSGETLTATSDCKKELIIMMGSVHDAVAQTCTNYFEVSPLPLLQIPSPNLLP